MKIFNGLKKRIKVENTEIKYKVRKSNRAKRLRIAVYRDASIIVTVPFGINKNKVEGFIIEKANWIISKLRFFEQFKNSSIMDNSAENYLKYKLKALELAERKIEYYNKACNFKFNKINIKNQKTKWGSCSKKGNLNFNYKIALMPEKIADYIVVHELCHLKEFNHSGKFWNLVAELTPDYLEIKKELKNNGFGSMH